MLDVDLLDGTPILDMKPYVPEFDARTDARIGWYASATRKDEQVKSDKPVQLNRMHTWREILHSRNTWPSQPHRPCAMFFGI